MFTKKLNDKKHYKDLKIKIENEKLPIHTRKIVIKINNHYMIIANSLIYK